MSNVYSTSTTLTKQEEGWWRKAFEPHNWEPVSTGTLVSGAYTPNIYQEVTALAQRVKKLEEDIPKMVEAFLKAIEEVKNESK